MYFSCTLRKTEIIHTVFKNYVDFSKDRGDKGNVVGQYERLNSGFGASTPCTEPNGAYSNCCVISDSLSKETSVFCF